MENETRGVGKLEKVFSALEPWHPLFGKIDRATSLKEKMVPKDEDTREIIKYFAESNYYDEEAAQAYLFEESKLKGRRSYLASRLDDDIHGLVARRRHLEQVAKEAYVPERIAFWNENSHYTTFLKQRDLLREQGGNNDGQVGDLCLAMELPMSLMKAQNLIGNSSWNDVVGRTDGSPRLDSRLPFVQIPKEIWYDLDALSNYYKTNFEEEGVGHAGGIWKNRTDLIQGQPGDVRSHIYAIKEGNKWTTHLHVGNPHNAMYVLSKLVGKDPSPYNISMPFGTERVKIRKGWQVE
jgi:hypothetical protein